MRIGDVEHIPKVFVENRHIGFFIPPATFGYLYLISSDPLHLFFFSIMSAVSIVIYMFSDLPQHGISINETKEAGNFAASFLIAGYIIGCIFLYIEHSISANEITSEEVVFLILLFSNICWLSGFSVYNMFKTK